MYIDICLGGEDLQVNPAAVSCIRYRTLYGESIVNHMEQAGSVREAERHLLRLLHAALVDDKWTLKELAKLARRDPERVVKLLRVKQALLSCDSKATTIKKGGDKSQFDEYDVLAIMAAAGIDTQLIYELPIMHLVSISNRSFDLRNPDKKQYRKLSDDEMAALYPRRVNK